MKEVNFFVCFGIISNVLVYLVYTRYTTVTYGNFVPFGQEYDAIWEVYRVFNK